MSLTREQVDTIVRKEVFPVNRDIKFEAKRGLELINLYLDNDLLGFMEITLAIFFVEVLKEVKDINKHSSAIEVFLQVTKQWRKKILINY